MAETERIPPPRHSLSTRIENWMPHRQQAIPFFVESQFAHEQGMDPCARIWRRLRVAHVEPVPFGTTVAEVNQIARSMKAAGCAPAIFVVNTLNAKDMIKRLDPVMGETPALFLRRELVLGQSGLAEYLLPDPDTAHTLHVLGKLTLRLSSVWYYGARTLDSVAERAAEALLAYLKDRDFRRIETARNWQAGWAPGTRHG